MKTIIILRPTISVTVYVVTLPGKKFANNTRISPIRMKFSCITGNVVTVGQCPT